MPSDLSSTSSCEDWGNPYPLFALLQTAKPKQVLSKHQDCYSELLYFKNNRKANPLVYSSVLSNFCACFKCFGFGFSSFFSWEWHEHGLNMRFTHSKSAELFSIQYPFSGHFLFQTPGWTR